MALNVARGTAAASNHDPEAWKSLVSSATGSPLLGAIAKYNVEKAVQAAKTRAASERA